MNVYAQDGVDFGKEHDVVAVFKALYKATKPFTADLERYGFSAPDDIGYFSDGITIDTARLCEVMEGKKIALVFGMDGPGTKPRVHLTYLQIKRSREEVAAKEEVAELANLSRSCVGICEVAMVANDIICGGARPAYALDYVAWHDPNVEIARDIASGLYIGAKQAGMTIVGGENASLSEMINGYDSCIAGIGFILNPKHLENPLTGEKIEVGDVIIGIGSSGVHCNGISTARKKLIWSPIINWMGRYYVDEVVPELGKTTAEEILTPTIIYREPVLDGVLGDDEFTVRAVVNITGEGIHNLKRALKGKKDIGVGARIDLTKEEKLRPQPVFDLVQREGNISDREMWEDYNMGIGMQMIVPRDQAEIVVDRLERYQVGDQQIRASMIGEIVEDNQQRIYLKTDKFEDVY